MGAWLADNWLDILLLLWAIERAGGLKALWKKRARVLSDTIERESKLVLGTGPSAKELLPEAYHGDVLLDTLLDGGVDPKDKPRVTRLRRAGRGLLSVLPLVTRLLDRNH